MIIKRLSAAFGRLTNETLHLTGGLNIIQAPNECGKSTWCAFIKAMLYGIRTSDRDKAGYLSDKTRYRPWNGAAMEGAMDIETGGLSLTIERKSEGKLPMKSFSAVYTGTAATYDGLYPDTAGDTLTGASEAVFERSAYISQAGVKISQTPELEKRISSLVTTGDESSSYTEADERLRLWLRKRRFNKSGTIPALEEALAGINKKLSFIVSALDDATSLRLEAERLKKRQTELQAELDAFDTFESQKTARRAREDLALMRARYEDIHRQLSKNGVLPDPGELTAIRGDLKALESFRTMHANAQQRLNEASIRAAATERTRAASPFDRPDGPRAVESAALLEHEIKKLSFNGISALILILVIAAATFMAIMPDFLIPAAAVAAAGILTLLWRAVRRAGLAKKLSALLSNYGVESADGLRALSIRHAETAAECAALDGDVRAAEKSLAAAEASYRSLYDILNTKLRAIAPSSTPDNAATELNRLEALMVRLQQARADVQAAESVLRAMAGSVNTDATAENEAASAPTRSRREITTDLSYITARLEELTNRYNMALGEVRAVGDPVILGSEKISAETELTAQKNQYDALSLAIETLKDANNELQSRFSPLLSETAGRIIQRLTGGRYEKLTFDKTLDVNAKASEETVSRNVLALSCGTADQIYLALRLAVCALLLPKDSACPLILDDVLANFDDERAQLALDYLKELAEERQVLLFTCHKREAAYFSGNTGVNVIKLPRS